VAEQQAARFVAGLAKNPLSDRIGFGMMRVASQKEFKEVPDRGDKIPTRFQETQK
jgi:hypothetical protein